MWWDLWLWAYRGKEEVEDRSVESDRSVGSCCGKEKAENQLVGSCRGKEEDRLWQIGESVL